MMPDGRELTSPRQPIAPAPFRFSFSTDMVPETDRVGFFREELSKVLRLEVELLDDSPPQYAIESILAGPVAINSVQGSPTRVSRSKAQLVDDDDSFLFLLHTGRKQEISHNGRAIILAPGDACVIQNSRPSAAAYPEGGSTLVVRMDGMALRAVVREPEALAGNLIAHNRPGVNLLNGYLRSFTEAGDGLTGDLLRTFGLHVIDLVASILGATRDGAAQAEVGGIRAARLRQVLDRIATQACNPGFNVEAVAAELAVSSRTIQLMLEETGSTFSGHVGEHRMRQAWRLLADPKSNLSIAEVAFAVGYNDLSHFYRAFRRRFGETPAVARATGRRLH